ncbi:division/cell wall cluster transcriptional repressor MraZ [Lichenifustis flavocetrariae]|uniref:Transcriptional regulator MraZ n=1 Tax=Lichenifustis flavocetrariae TaxID=2949735 RepID=A0AA41Z194_9HYPH|nr:division/cell wall cluster transcriptional repressor MraZ [Lichenifustis flavocetrariae]MCW6511126.1 division/cell wall cluster transcriptional repressor MraZ [Lichenifustis flavocetrariae]
MDLFLSNFTNKLDAKGRVSIPASFRGVLNRDGFEGLYVTPSFEAQAVDCGGHALLQEIETLLAPFSTGSHEWEAFAATLYGQSEILKVDGEGRIVVSEGIRSHAGIANEITFVGMGRKFQLWEPGRFQAYLAEAKGRVREARKQLGSPGQPAERLQSEVRK